MLQPDSVRGELTALTKIPGTGRVTTLNQQFGDIDIYLFDQLLRRRIVPGMRVLDAGCGWGRNPIYLLRASMRFRSRRRSDVVAAVRRLAVEPPSLPA